MLAGTGLLLLIGLAVLSAPCGGDNRSRDQDTPALPTRPSGTADGAAPEDLDSAAAAPTLRAVTTLYVLEYFTRRIAGDSVEVVNLIPPGVEAHDFEPTPADIRKLDEADLIVYNGSGFESWIGRALKAIDDDSRIVMEVSRGLTDKPFAADDEEGDDGAHEVLDPHLWLAPLKAIRQVNLIRDGLTRAKPARAQIYTENAQDLIGELEKLHHWHVAALRDCRLRKFVTSHAAFGYLAAAYGLEQVPISGLSPESEPSPRHMAKLVDTIRDLGVKHLLVEPGISPRLAETLASEVGATLLTLHPLENLTADELARGENYDSLMYANLDSLSTALECTQ